MLKPSWLLYGKKNQSGTLASLYEANVTNGWQVDDRSTGSSGWRLKVGTALRTPKGNSAIPLGHGSRSSDPLTAGV